jgi:hypothetical protein
MMKLTKGKYYTNNYSDLMIYISQIYFQNDEYIKIKGLLFNKNNGILYENKSYKLYWDNIKNWEEIC